jgi:hypothetical protein
MHTNFNAMLPSLRLVRSFGWRGPLGAYPDHGYFVPPKWVAEELKPGVAADMAWRWVTETQVCNATHDPTVFVC